MYEINNNTNDNINSNSNQFVNFTSSDSNVNTNSNDSEHLTVDEINDCIEYVVTEIIDEITSLLDTEIFCNNIIILVF